MCLVASATWPIMISGAELAIRRRVVMLGEPVAREAELSASRARSSVLRSASVLVEPEATGETSSTDRRYFFARHPVPFSAAIMGANGEQPIVAYEMGCEPRVARFGKNADGQLEALQTLAARVRFALAGHRGGNHVRT